MPERKKALVIGGAGYTGAPIVKKLVEGQHEVTVFDNLTYDGKAREKNELPNSLRRVNLILSGGISLPDALQADLTGTDLGLKPRDYRFILGDIRDRETVMNLIANGRYTHVLQLGELVGIEACRVDPRTTTAINYRGTRNVVDGVLASPYNPKLIWPSSSSIYFRSLDGTLFTEESPLPEFGLLDEYCQNKILVEGYIKEKREKRDFESVVLRPATVGGLSPRMRVELLPNHIAYSFLAASGMFDLAHPQDDRAVIHIDDLTDFYVNLVEATNWHSGVFNIGKFNLSKGEYVSQICELVGLRDDVTVPVVQAGDLRSLGIDSGKLLQTYGFSPRRGLAEIIQPIVDLLKSNRTVFSSQSEDPFLVNPEFTNTPPEKFREMLMAVYSVIGILPGRSSSLTHREII